MLMLCRQKFSPINKVFDMIMLWVRLPNLLLHLWFDSCLEVVSDALGTFLMVDEGSSNLLHYTFSWILVDMDISKGLPEEIMIKTTKGCLTRPLDYEGVPFRCRLYF